MARARCSTSYSSSDTPIRLYGFDLKDFARLDRIITDAVTDMLLFDEIQIIPEWEQQPLHGISAEAVCFTCFGFKLNQFRSRHIKTFQVSFCRFQWRLDIMHLVKRV